jgi:o-succinylbenzoate synthase
MRIHDIKLYRMGLELNHSFQGASVSFSKRQILLLEIVDDANFSVWSECVALTDSGYNDEIQSAALEALKTQLIPAVLGREFSHPTAVIAYLESVLPGFPMAKAALEMGIWALFALKSGQTLSQYIGGNKASVLGAIVLGFDSDYTDAILHYSRVTLKIKPGFDLDYVTKWRQLLPPDVALAVDGNESFGEADMNMLIEMGNSGLVFIEQPFSRFRLDLHARLQSQIASPLSLDESISSVDDLAAAIALGSFRLLNLKPGRVGGFLYSFKMIEMCKLAGISVRIGGMFESGVGRSYGIALASVSDCVLPNDISASDRYWASDVLKNGIEISDGKILVKDYHLADFLDKTGFEYIEII